MSGSLNAYYDPAAHAAMHAEVNAERGERVEIGVFYNDRRTQDRDPTDIPDPDPRPLLPQTTMRWKRKLDSYDHQLFLHIDDIPGTLHMTLLADTHLLSPLDIAVCARGIETILVTAALDPAASTGVADHEPAGPPLAPAVHATNACSL